MSLFSIKSFILLGLIILNAFATRDPRHIFFNKEYKKHMFNNPNIGIVFSDDKFHIFRLEKDDTTFGKTDIEKKAMEFFKSEVINCIKNIIGCDIVKTGTIKESFISQVGYISKSYGSFPVEYPANGTVLSLSEEISDVDLVIMISKICMANFDKKINYGSSIPISGDYTKNGPPIIYHNTQQTITTSELITNSNIILWDNVNHKLVYYAMFEGNVTPNYDYEKQIYPTLIKDWTKAIKKYCKEILSKIVVKCSK